MKIIIQGVKIAFALALLADTTLAQPALPPMPAGELLNAWPFAGSNYLSFRHTAPLALTNVALVPTWAGNGLQVDSPDPAAITYDVVEPNGHTNLDLTQGTIEMWFSPDWSSPDGLGNWGTILEVGSWNTNLASATGAWGLYISPDASSLYFSAQANGISTNYLTAPISWNSGEWHHIALTYSATNSAFYLEGQLAATGPGVTFIPGADILTNGFSIGSDGNATGLLQAAGIFNYLTTYNYQLDGDLIALDYSDESANVSPLPSSGGSLGGRGFTMDFEGPPSPGGTGGSGGGGGGSYFVSPQYRSNDFWLQALSLGTNGYNTDPNLLTLILHGTQPNVAYQILYTTNLLSVGTVWTIAQNLMGAPLNNFTPTTISITSASKMFFRATAYSQDTDGDGLPDWWELKYSTSSFPLDPTKTDTGNTGIPDGSKQDSAGDGYSNLQKYEMGVPPGTWVTPISPVLSSVINSNGTSAKLTWEPALGNVLSYTIYVDDDWTTNGFVVLTTVAAGTTSFVDTVSQFNHGIQYEMQANYAGGSSALSSQSDPSVNPAFSLNVYLARGSNGRFHVVLSSVPTSVQTIRISTDPFFGDEYYWNPLYDYNAPWGDVPAPPYTNIDIPINSFTNGAFTIPDSLLPLYSISTFSFQAIGTNGVFGPLTYPTWPSVWAVNIPFLNGNVQMEENLSFQLREATQVDPFQIYNINYFTDPVTGPSNYVAAGFYGNSSTYETWNINEFKPFEDNSFYKNFIYSYGDLEQSGFLDTYLGYCYAYWGAPLGFTNRIERYSFDINDFVQNGVTNIPSPLLNSWQWSLPTRNFPSQLYGYNYANYSSLSEIGLYFTNQPSPGVFTFIGGTNYFGLPFQTVECAFTNSNNVLTTFTIGTGSPLYNTSSNSTYNFYTSVATPQYTLIDQYFGRMPYSYYVSAGGLYITNTDPMPGDAIFDVTNATPPLLLYGLGNSFMLCAWAKEGIANGSSNVFAYLQWYFDQAFLGDANGNISTNQTGILSEYGQFFPTEPGKVFLTTKPNALSQRGTNAVYIFGMCVDANHDGVMDTSWTGLDTTSANRPFKFWINDDWDTLDNASDPGKDAENPLSADFNLGNVHSQRDLEDFARLWICGMPALTNGYAVSLSWNVISGSPSIQLINAVETNGGIGYLTNASVAASQATTYYDDSTQTYSGPGHKFATISPGQPYTFPSNYFTNANNKYFLFDGAGIGTGELVLGITDTNGNIVASASVFISLDAVKNMIEHAEAVNITDAYPPSSLTSRLQIDGVLPADPTESKQMIVLVHGINNSPWAAESSGETLYKRLFWSGYHGRVSVFRWPAPPLPPSTANLNTYNLGEFYAWKAASAFKDYLTYLRNNTNRLAGYSLNILAHSQGNVVASEALNLGAPFDNYILTQGAIPAFCYDSDTNHVPILQKFLDAETANGSTPLIASDGGYESYFTDLTGNLINFYNTNDYALITGTVAGIQANWEQNQILYKPESFPIEDISYSFSPSTQNSYRWNNFSPTQVSDAYEIKSMVARSRSHAIGAQNGAQGVIVASIDLANQFQFGTARSEHSAQFTRPVQTVWPYYDEVLRSLKIQTINR